MVARVFRSGPVSKVPSDSAAARHPCLRPHLVTGRSKVSGGALVTADSRVVVPAGPAVRIIGGYDERVRLTHTDLLVELPPPHLNEKRPLGAATKAARCRQLTAAMTQSVSAGAAKARSAAHFAVRPASAWTVVCFHAATVPRLSVKNTVTT